MAPEPSAQRGPGPWSLALRRLRRNRLALAFLALFVLIVAFCLAAPLWANHVAGTGPNATHTLEKVTVGGEERDVVSPEGRPIGPLWFGAGGKFFLGADGRLGRDEMVRLMYGGRTSLLIGVASALLTTVLALLLGLLAGYFKGLTDGIIARVLDVLWALPTLLIAIALGTALAVSGIDLGPIEIDSGSLWIPILVIGVLSVPYMARPIRGEVLALSSREFVEAAVAQGAGAWRIMLGELLPNLGSTVLVFFAINFANNMLFEAGLSFLGVGVQPPNSSWGKMVSEGVGLMETAPVLAIAPGLLIMLTVLALNVIGDGLRDALDPRSKIRLEAHAGLPEPEGTAV